jgi:hypothetical protein
MATTATRDDACPYEWAEYNLPQELRSADKSISPFARLVLDAAQSQQPGTNSWPFDSRLRTGSKFRSFLLPGLGIPLPKL